MRTLRDTTPPPAEPEPSEPIMGYTILTAASAERLERAVREHLFLGWEPMGQPMVVAGTLWYQAMMKEPLE